LARTDANQMSLCFDVDSGLLNTTEGELFFDDDGTPSQSISEVLQFLNQVTSDQSATLSICATLNKFGLIKPWPITVKMDSNEQVIEGLFCIDEHVLNELPSQDFEIIRSEGALPLAYCQLISMQHLSTLAQLAESQDATIE